MKTKEFKSRVEELSLLDWPDLKLAAEAAGHVKPDDEKWVAQSEAIATAEFKKQGRAVEYGLPEDPSAVVVEEKEVAIAKPANVCPFPTAYYAAVGIAIGSDGDKIKTDSDGHIINGNS